VASVASAGQIWSYAEAANPVRRGLSEPLRPWCWPASLHGPGPTARLSLLPPPEQGLEAEATSPALAAAFLRLRQGESLRLPDGWTSLFLYVLQGEGDLGPAPSLPWARGDALVLPATAGLVLRAASDAVIYAVDDGPLLRWLGAVPAPGPRFTPLRFDAAVLEQQLRQVAGEGAAARANRVSILLGHPELPTTRTVSPSLWAMLGLVAPGSVQAPHRHQSLALDLILTAPPGCHTLVGERLNPQGEIVDPQRIDWEDGGAFLTPAGWWHSHVNPSDQEARLLPVQDAGLHSHLRSLDIRFAG
jgi:gentisate 1,2-dioxygenase